MIGITKEQVAELSQNLTKSVSVSHAEKGLNSLVKKKFRFDQKGNVRL